MCDQQFITKSVRVALASQQRQNSANFRIGVHNRFVPGDYRRNDYSMKLCSIVIHAGVEMILYFHSKNCSARQNVWKVFAVRVQPGLRVEI
jgi:hypothetical protein